MDDGMGAGATILVGLISLGIGIAVIIACCNVADRKGYDTTLAGVMGFVFGIWAYLFYLILPDKSYSKSSSGGDMYGMGGGTGSVAPPPPQHQRNCWSCGSGVAGNAATCPNCGIKLNF